MTLDLQSNLQFIFILKLLYVVFIDTGVILLNNVGNM